MEMYFINNPSRLRRSQILVAGMPPPRSQRTVGAQLLTERALTGINYLY